MSVSSEIEKVVSGTFARLGERNGDLSRIPVVLRNGRCIGQTFESAQFRAIWLFDREVIVFFRKSGGLVTAISVGDALSMGFAA